MFSKFEPGGLVHLEYFSGGTSMIATKTGGLADTIEEINTEEKTGTGIFIPSNTADALVKSAMKVRKIFDDKTLYKALRDGCYDKAIDTKEGAIAYLSEFYRMKNKIFVDKWEHHPLKDLSIANGTRNNICLELSRPEIKKVFVRTSFDKFTQSHRLEKVKGTNTWAVKNAEIPNGLIEYYFLLENNERYIDLTSPTCINDFFETLNVVMIERSKD